jgi:hypothetical protein
MIRFCDTIRRAEMIKAYTVNRSMLQKDGVTLFPSSLVRYIETVGPPIRLAIDTYSGRTSEDPDVSLTDVSETC